jgi:RNA polymerase sigma-70 factor, ECF subfamily
MAMNSRFSDSTEKCRLLGRVSQGDRSAFGELFERYRGELLRAVAMRLDRQVRARLDPSDVVQETRLEAYRRLDDYLARRPMPLGLWLRKTAHERLLKLHEKHFAGRRSVRREAFLPERTSSDLLRRMVSQGESPSQHLMVQEQAQRVREALEKLPATDREILVMRYMEKLSNAAIGYVLDLSPAAVSKRHGRALTVRSPSRDPWANFAFAAKSVGGEWAWFTRPSRVRSSAGWR